MSRKQQKILEGIEDSSLATRIAYSRLCAACVEHEAGLMGQGENSDALRNDLLTQAWLIVDSAHRLNGLLRQLPGLKRTPAVDVIRKETATAETLRNYIQHLKDDETPDEPTALWGAFRWVSKTSEPNRFAHHIYIPGPLTEGQSSPSFRVERPPFRDPIDHFTLTAGGSEVNLTLLIVAIERFERRLKKTLAEVTINSDDRVTLIAVGLDDTALV